MSNRVKSTSNASTNPTQHAQIYTLYKAKLYKCFSSPAQQTSLINRTQQLHGRPKVCITPQNITACVGQVRLIANSDQLGRNSMARVASGHNTWQYAKGLHRPLPYTTCLEHTDTPFVCSLISQGCTHCGTVKCWQPQPKASPATTQAVHSLPAS